MAMEHLIKAPSLQIRLTFPQGALWHKGALYVTSPPNVWKFEDTTGNGVWQTSERYLSTSSATPVMLPVFMDAFLGPEGRIYWCDGFHGHEFRDKKQQKSQVRKLALTSSPAKTDGSDVQIHCGGGMDNPVEIDFTEEG